VACDAVWSEISLPVSRGNELVPSSRSKVKAMRSSETSEIYQTTRRHIAEYSTRKRYRDNHNVINEEQIEIKEFFLPFGSDSVILPSPNHKD
jgi:hypothetical protein